MVIYKRISFLALAFVFIRYLSNSMPLEGASSDFRGSGSNPEFKVHSDLGHLIWIIVEFWI